MEDSPCGSEAQSYNCVIFGCFHPWCCIFWLRQQEAISQVIPLNLFNWLNQCQLSAHRGLNDELNLGIQKQDELENQTICEHKTNVTVTDTNPGNIKYRSHPKVKDKNLFRRLELEDY